MNGAQALIESLRQERVTNIFGYAGATICPIMDALKDAAEIDYTLVRTEQNAGHMASGYARVGGKVGVCIVTSGPGATNLITGIATDVDLIVGTLSLILGIKLLYNYAIPQVLGGTLALFASLAYQEYIPVELGTSLLLLGYSYAEMKLRVTNERFYT